MIYAVIIFVVGSSIQAGAINIAMLFLGRCEGGFPNASSLSSPRQDYCWIRCRNVDDGHSIVHF